MTSNKNLDNIIMNNDNKNMLKEQREKLKIFQDAIRYQKLLLSAERKLKNKKMIKERIQNYQNRKKDLEAQIKEHPVVVERKDKPETIKQVKITKINERLQRKQSKKDARQKRIEKKQKKQTPVSDEKLYLQFIPPHDKQVHDEIIIPMLTDIRRRYTEPVSYTHLTLPTN